MSNYTKPTISLISLNVTSAAASNCSTSTADAEELKSIIDTMGFDINNVFASHEQCTEPIDFADYCKFSSGIQVFFS